MYSPFVFLGKQKFYSSAIQTLLKKELKLDEGWGIIRSKSILLIFWQTDKPHSPLGVFCLLERGVLCVKTGMRIMFDEVLR